MDVCHELYRCSSILIAVIFLYIRRIKSASGEPKGRSGSRLFGRLLMDMNEADKFS